MNVSNLPHEIYSGRGDMIDMNSQKYPNFERKQQLKLVERASHSKNKLDESDIRSMCSATTTTGANVAFFAGSINDRSSHTNSYSWKSKSTHLADEFVRIQRLVKHLAPEQFRNPSRPSNGPCGIVPTTVLEYVEHAKDILSMKAKQMETNFAAKKEAARVARIKENGEVQRPIKSQFGEGAKVYTNGLSPVLCKPTIWSIEYSRVEAEGSEWPTKAELQECGDRRENDQVATRCGRYLPPPQQKLPCPRKDVSCIDRGMPAQIYCIKRFWPLDEQGPIFSDGPSPMEVTNGNFILDNDPVFEDKGHILIGNNLMEDIGEWKPSFVPGWLAERRQQEAHEQALRLAQEQVMWMVPYVPYIRYEPHELCY